MTVIRDAVIRIRTERSGSVGGGYESRAFAAEARAAREAATEIEGANRRLGEHGEGVQRFSRTSINEYAKIGRGLADLGRGVALMAASTDEDLQRMLKTIVAVEAGVSTVKGSIEAFRGLSAVIGIGTTIAAGFATAITGAFVAIDYFSESSRRARKEVEDFNAVREHGLRLSKLEAESLREQASLRGEQGSIDREIAVLGGPAAQIATLDEFGRTIAKERSNAGRAENAARNYLGGIESGDFPEASRNRTMQQLLDAEMRQQEALRREIQNGRDLEAAKLQQVNEQQSKLRSGGGGFSVFGDFGKAVDDAAIAGLERQKEEIKSKSAEVLKELLTELRSQVEQVSQVRRDIQSLER